MKASSRKSSLATILIAIGSIAAASAEKITCSIDSDNSAAGGFSTSSSTATPIKNDYHDHCYTWPAEGVPPEHSDNACNRSIQNAVWAADDSVARSAPPEDLIKPMVYLNLPEEKSWTCPLDTVDETAGSVKHKVNNNGVDGQKSTSYVGATGHPTRWIVHNKASNPIILTHINALGLEVSAMDFSTYPAHSNTAVYPNGPIVLPGTMAVVEGRQGQMFVVREYKEVLPMDAMNDDEIHHHSLKSFKSVLPSTLSFLPQQTRYETNKGVWHILGHSGRVLMKHRMGNIYIKNQFGAICPEVMGGGSGGGGEDNDVDDDPKGNAEDMDPDCNVMRKAFINKVGCPVDIYFAPQNKIEGYNCETFTKHLGPLDPFLSKRNIDVDAHNSPLKFENTYNGHNFVARMSHDHSLVARIELDHDIVRDCPEPKRSGAGVEVRLDEIMLPIDTMQINATESVYTSKNWLASANHNATASPIITGKTRQEKHGLLWHNRTGVISASVPIAS
eukprot:CAMPEP_0172316594 /NCGR_PEP_ID=MMETSP1058-20130122/28764_1 /TAXON_ID=83371 /ORGANISM="Detonula confervacea, Strain CCMP 353" /LENGTH=502 /DNA_ID=CAMNT_0013030935 /DNA_START=36 /DNA_END=1544 /DNA_ORIENTATION=-